MNNFKVELEERLIAFAATVLKAVEALPEHIRDTCLAEQIAGAAIAPALSYSAQPADTPKEFLNKLKGCLKALRENHIYWRIVKKASESDAQYIDPILEECNSLAALLAKSVKTKKQNLAEDGKAKEADALIETE